MTAGLLCTTDIALDSSVVPVAGSLTLRVESMRTSASSSPYVLTEAALVESSERRLLVSSSDNL